MNSEQQQELYFEIELPEKAEFILDRQDWLKLKTIQNGHRYQRGEWEDFFVLGMKESNKYCVFAFKDHYVNESAVRNCKIRKYFSAHGYCVFENCQVRFNLQMIEECRVEIRYQGKIRHKLNEMHARYFRGKSRQDLKETLKYTKPSKEYLNRMRSADNEQMSAGNADGIGLSASVYRRIAAEAKDIYQSILLLRNDLIEDTRGKKIKGFIQLIQHVPGCLVCFSEEQIHLFNAVAYKNTLYIGSTDQMVSTTIDSKNLRYYEACLIDKTNKELLPISCMFESENDTSMSTWLQTLVHAKDSFSDDKKSLPKQVICEFNLSLATKIIRVLNNEDLSEYLDRVYLKLTNQSKQISESYEGDFSDIIWKTNQKETLSDKDKVEIHFCGNQVLNELSKLCLETLNKENYQFGVYSFNRLVNCSCLNELIETCNSIFTIFLSKYRNALVETSFEYLKTKSIKTVLPQKNQINANTTFNLNFKSKFYYLAINIRLKVEQELDNIELLDENSPNPRFSPNLVDRFIQQYSSFIPLFCHNFNLNLLNERFSLLKSLFAHHDKESLDVFIKRIYNENITLLRPYMNNYLANVSLGHSNDDNHKRKSYSKATDLIKLQKSIKRKKDINNGTKNFTSDDFIDTDSNEVIIERQTSRLSVDLSKDDLDTLEYGQSLSENIIEFCLKLLESNYESIKVLSNDFYSCLKYGYDIESSFDVFEYQIILIPIKKNGLWNLITINFANKSILFYDFIGLNDIDCLKFIK